MATCEDLEQTVDNGSDAVYDVFCTPCANDNKHSEAENYCVECGEYFCVRCIQDHNKFAIMKSHQILDKVGFAALGAKQTSSLPTERCVAHHGKIIDTYCPDHRTVACPTCISIYHRFCEDVTYLPIAAKDILASQQYGKTKHAIQDMQKKLGNLKQTTQKDIENLGFKKAHALKRIQEYRAALEYEIDRMAKRTTDALNSKHNQFENALADQIKNIESILVSLEDKRQSIVNVNDDNETSLFVHIINGQLFVDEGHKLIQAIKDEPIRKKIAFEKNEAMEIALKTTEQFGPIIGEIHNKPEQKKESRLIGRATVGLTKKETKPLSAAFICNFNVNTDTDKNVCGIEGCCLLDDGTLVITDRSNRKLKKFDTGFQVKDSCRMIYEPFGVCVTDINEVAVALSAKNMVQFVTVSHNLQCTRSFKTDGRCCGLACADNAIFVSYHNKDELHVYSKTGTLLLKSSLNTACFSQTSMYMDSYITLSADRTNVLYNNSKNGVITMSTNGNMVSSFTNTDLKNAAGMCVLENGDILVCEYNASQIVQFTADGRKLGAVLQQRGGLRKPQAMCVDKGNLLIIVAMDDADTMKVFKYD